MDPGAAAAVERMAAGHNQAQLPEDIGMFLDRLRAECDSIDAVWLMDPKPGARERAEWRLLLFGDEDVVDVVRRDPQWQRRDVTLLVVTDGDRFTSAWGSRLSGRLSDLDWRLEDPDLATFVPPETRAGERETAARVR